MATTPNQPLTRDQAKVMNRYDIAKRMLKYLKAEEAVAKVREFLAGKS